MTKTVIRILATPALLALFAFILAGCEEMPKDDMVYRVGLSVDIPGASMASAANSSGDGRALDASALPEGYNIVSDGPLESSMFDPAGSFGVPLAGATTYHLRVIISDPREEHFVFNYVPGSIADITAASGVERLITVEAYEIAAISPGMGMLTARHFVTITSSSDRTVSLVGQPVRLSITVAENTNTGAIIVNPPFPASTPSGTVNLPPASGCPTEFGYFATVTDNAWGLSFPSFPVLPYTGAVHQTISVSGLPKGRTFTFLVQHSSVDLTAVTDVYVANASQEASLLFTGMSNPSIVLSPEKDLADLIPGEIVEVGVDASGGWGSIGSASVGSYDSCSGSVSGATYSFMVPYGQDYCNIHVSAGDCGGGYGEVQKTATIDKAPPPQCMDGADNDQDGLIDYPQDPGCANAYEDNELGATACDDGIDNDGDGYRDMYDPGCSSPTDSSELGSTACDDGIDGDGWGDSDVSDPGCSGPADNSELGSNACDDGIGNDGWGDVDWADPGCSGPSDSSEYGTAACDDGVDNDTWGDIDVLDPACAAPTDTTELLGTECDDGVDNDTWGDIDSADPACLAPTDMTELLGTECDDNIDNDGWGDADSADPACSAPADMTEYSGTACDDGVDNDGWGDADWLDPACKGPDGITEYLGTACDDGIDNDGWGDADWLDPACLNPTDITELSGTACDDGVDNDTWGDIDVADPACVMPSDNTEYLGTECDDGIDNDTWGDIDSADPACSSPSDITELLGSECDDGFDNDGWGDTDSADPACSAPTDTTEFSGTECDDGVDNDGWLDIDVMDPGCSGPADASEYGAGACDDGVNNDSDGLVDFFDPGCFDPSDSAETDPGSECDDGIDNDTWGDIDMADPACADPTDPSELLGTECDDNFDNDGWGDTDSADPACSAPTDTTEFSGTACDDGVDNDGWGDFDVDDPACATPAGNSEFLGTACDDGVDNDGDGLTDWEDLLACVQPSDTAEFMTWYVKPGGISPVGDSWAEAFGHPMDALIGASSGDRVFVAAGVYPALLPGSTMPVVTMVDGVELYGGFLGTESGLNARTQTPTLNPTILDGQNQSWHVLIGASNARLDGFLVSGGNANGPTPRYDTSGGGMYVDGKSNLLIDNCLFLNNFGNYDGGGIYARNTSNLSVQNSVFQFNSVGPGNSGSGGGAIHCDSSPLSVSNCLFNNNSTSVGFFRGGAIWLSQSSPAFIDNSTFTLNYGSDSGSAIFAGSFSNVTIDSSILYGNLDPATSVIENYLLVGGNQITVNYSDIQGGWTGQGSGNIDQDPLFTPDFRLSQTAAGNFVDSPCVDAGGDTAANLGLDQGTTRTDGVADSGQVDMGFHWPAGSTEAVSAACLVSKAGNNTNGLTWATAFNHPQTCVDLVGSGADVWVSQGRYVRLTGGTSSVLTMKNGVDVYGGFTGSETSLAERGIPMSRPTLLDGENMSEHVVRGNSNARLDGFVIEGGHAYGAAWMDKRGGGLIVQGCSNFIIDNCLFQNNVGEEYAGAINSYNTNIQILNTIFYNNSTSGAYPGLGGAIHFYAGGVPNGYSALVKNCLFHDNVANNGGQGGAIAFWSYNSTQIQNCTFANNQATSSGGAFYVWNLSGSINVRNSIFYGNVAPSNQSIAISSGSVNVDYSNIAGGWAGTGNLNLNPAFVPGVFGNYYLNAASPCVNAGGDTSPDLGLDTKTTDPSNAPDIGTVDMGFHWPIP